MLSTLVKGCRVRDFQTIRKMDELGYDFAGVHSIESLNDLRLAEIGRLTALTTEYDLSIKLVLLTKVANIGQIVYALDRTGIHWLQLHRQWAASDLLELRNRLGLRRDFVKIIMLVDPAFISAHYDYAQLLDVVDFVILDHRAGGTGRLLLPDAVQRALEIIDADRVFLAGGLTAENVAETVLQYRPHAIDVQSGVLDMAGRQDPIKLAAFIQAVRMLPSELTIKNREMPHA